MIPSYLLLLLGLVMLFLSGKYLVDASVAIARRLNIPTMIIGLTVVAFGTSAPELLVSLQAAVAGYPEIAMGNVVGSNISNVLLVLALTAIIFPIPVPASSVRKDWPVLMFVSILLFVFCLDGNLDRWEGAVLVGLLLAYVLLAVYLTRREAQARLKNAPGGDSHHKPELKPGMVTTAAILVFVASCAGLAVGANLLVKNAAAIATDLGISQRVISVTMVAVGTSIPELATSVVAALKKETEISVGNILGSNIMNILTVLGITGLTGNIPVDSAISGFDIPWMLGVHVLLLLMMIPAARSRITRWEGVFMVSIYLLYIYLIF